MSKLDSLLHIFKHRCYYCETIVARQPGDRMATADHCVPSCRGGHKHEPNRVLACAVCNNVKGDMTTTEFRWFLATGTLAPSYVEHLQATLAKRLKPRFAEIPVVPAEAPEQMPQA